MGEHVTTLAWVCIDSWDGQQNVQLEILKYEGFQVGISWTKTLKLGMSANEGKLTPTISNGNVWEQKIGNLMILEEFGMLKMSFGDQIFFKSIHVGDF